ncbi:hypothetical protein H8744_13085 [Oscillospiraceae bacterium N12]|uniref:Uncharacterized protein n=1 Tax=Jilunia laotingensis TaxID=2763675 RepID=A0A926F980_9BACT|nr:hypothetical protein [Jilunia laotingensis]MBC8594160.1 hypothetical protein [Jilunia laotingensis]
MYMFNSETWGCKTSYLNCLHLFCSDCPVGRTALDMSIKGFTAHLQAIEEQSVSKAGEYRYVTRLNR